MTMTDPISDMLTRIRNGYKAKHIRVDIPASKMKKEIARILLQENMIRNWREVSGECQAILRVYLKYGPGEVPAMIGSRRVSKPGLKIYKGCGEIRRIRNGLGLAIVSTSRGIITDREARKMHVGGEVLAEVW
jgi:small subunit ribosomal protein S8